MKVSYRTHPILKKLEKKELGNINAFERDAAAIKSGLNDFETAWKRITNNITHKVYFISQSFADAYEKAADKLFESDLWGEVEDCNVCFIAPWKEATVLNIKNDKANKVISCDTYDFVQGNTLASVLKVDIDYSSGDKPKRSMFGWISENLKNVEENVFNCVIMTLFIKYAEIEVKYLPANKKVKDISTKYVNETDSNIQVLDSTWFTTLVKSDAFKVRGHFRLQPCGAGMKDRKLIWINDFEKKGYVRNFKRAINLD